MSKQANHFASIITQPLNVYNFEIRIKSLVDEVNADILLTVQSTTFPSEQMRNMSLFNKGEEIQYPAKPQLGGDWSISIPESDKGRTHAELDRLKNAMYNQKTGSMTPTLWYDIEVFQKDLRENVVFSVVLHGCWIKGRNATNLNTQDVTTSWSNDYTFHYTWLEDKLVENLEGSPNPMGV